MNPGGFYVETAMYLVAPYREPLNQMTDITNTILSSPGDNLSQTVTVPNLKLHYLDIPAAFTGGEILIKANNCLELRYFLSKSSSVLLNHREGIGGFFELMFLNDQHNYSRASAQQNQVGFSVGASLNITEDLTNLKSRFGAVTNNYLYFFCPFLKEGSENSTFEVQVILNKNPVELKDGAQLEDAIIKENTGGDSSSNSLVANRTIEQRVQDIIREVKGDGQAAGVRQRMEESPQKYFEVIQRNASVELWSKNGADVKKVLSIPQCF